MKHHSDTLSRNKAKGSSLCLLCRFASETGVHLRLDCNVLEEKRRPVEDSLLRAADDIVHPVPDSEDFVPLLLDLSTVIDFSEH